MEETQNFTEYVPATEAMVKSNQKKRLEALEKNEAGQVATILVFKDEKDRYYIECIAINDFANALDITNGDWAEKGPIRKDLFDHWFRSLYGIIHPSSRLGIKKTFGDIFDSMTEEQKILVYYVIECMAKLKEGSEEK